MLEEEVPVLSATPQAVLVVRLFSSRVEYSPRCPPATHLPSWEKEPLGRMRAKVVLDYRRPEAWSLTPLLQDSYTCSGTHTLPLYRGAPSDTILRQLLEKSPTLEVSMLLMQKLVNLSLLLISPTQTLKFLVSKDQVLPLTSPKGHATVTLDILDGHLSETTRFSASHPALQYTSMLEAVGGRGACAKAGSEGGKRRLANIVLDSLPPKVREKGTKSKKYKQVGQKI